MILFDIYHLAEFNWIKNVLLHYKNKDYHLSCVNRGPLVQVIKSEITNINPIVIGNYKDNIGLFSTVFSLILPRLFLLFHLIKKFNYSLIVSTSYQAIIIAWLFKKKSILIDDDFNRIYSRCVSNLATVVLSPQIIKKKINRIPFNALIHWSYLSPSVFCPNENLLKSLGLVKKNYIFVREVRTDTFNYWFQKKGIIQKFANLIDPNVMVVFSLEDKSKRHFYPKEWILLQEPVKDIFSLMYYSSLVISSGDSVAREGATLGVPSIYCGIREMPVNKTLISKGILFKVKPFDVPNLIDSILSGKINIPKQQDFIDTLQKEWVDVNKLIQNKIKELNHQIE